MSLLSLRRLAPAALALGALAPTPTLGAMAAAAGAAPAAAPESQQNPYEASVPVPDQGAAARDAGLRAALLEVLMRVSGRPASPGFSTVTARSLALVQHYGFEQDPASGALRLRARFDGPAVDQAVRGLGLPVFGRTPGAVEELALRVEGVRTPADYGRTLAHLRGLHGVAGLAVDEVDGSSARLRLRMEGGGAALAAELADGRVLRALADGRYALAD